MRWTDFGWQGIRLRVPEDWNLGRVDGDRKSGYARLDDAEIVRVEIEWREPRPRMRESIPDLVDRYVEGLEKKAAKSGVPFSVRRKAGFLRRRDWLQGRDYETFTWEADFRAYNLALRSDSGRILLLRVLARLDERVKGQVETLFRSLEDHSDSDQWFWSVYGLTFRMPSEFALESHQLKSGHIQLSFGKEKEICRVQRISLARMLLKGAALEDWYPVFFRKQLRDLEIELEPGEVKGHPGLRIEGRPRSRWRQIMRPLPWVDPRPRQYLDGRAWHCLEGNKICVVEHLYRRPEQRGDLVEQVSDGYICHQEETPAEPGGDAQLAARPQ